MSGYEPIEKPTRIERLESDVSELMAQVAVLTSRMDSTKERVTDNHDSLMKIVESLVTKVEFTPVKLIAYGLASAIMSSVLLAILSKVIQQ